MRIQIEYSLANKQSTNDVTLAFLFNRVCSLQNTLRLFENADIFVFVTRNTLHISRCCQACYLDSQSTRILLIGWLHFILFLFWNRGFLLGTVPPFIALHQ